MKIVLATCVDDQIEKTQMFGVRYMPVWAYTLASYIRDVPGVEIELYDTRIHAKIKTPKADVYFISGINQDFDALVSYQHFLKDRFSSAKIVLGGPIVSSFKMAGKLADLKCFDHLFLGDGESAITKLVQDLKGGITLPKLIESKQKFQIEGARAMDAALIKSTYASYYGAVIEVSRGCPFLCEFCDIRTKPDNNSATNKNVSVIIEELDLYLSLGVTNVLLACDNFIGSPRWAEEFCDAVIEWRRKTNHAPRFYTWLTINLVDHPRLMDKMMAAGFDMFFIGIESFGTAQLLETAKLQNTKTNMGDSIRAIQSRGFVVVAGLIFGFDTDPDDAVDVALEGIRKSGLISGDPSLLTALPGTPLYRRMELAGRLRKSKLGLGGKKYVTNIRYLRPKDQMMKDFMKFVAEFNQPQYQWERYQNFVASLAETKKEATKGSYINVGSLFKLALRSPGSLISLVKRLSLVLNRAVKVYYVARAFQLTLRSPAKMSHFYFWLFNWSNSLLKYGNLSEADFDIDSVSHQATYADVLPEGYETDYFEPIPMTKIKAQRRATVRALEKAFSP